MLCYPMYGRKPEPGSHSGLLCCEKWFKDPFSRLFVHTFTGIGYRHFYKWAWFYLDVLAYVVFIKVDVLGLDRQIAAIGHCITGVDDEIHDDLFNLSGISLNVSEFRVQKYATLDAFPDDPPEHLLDVRD